MTNFNRTALYRLLVRAGDDVASGRCPGWACDYAVCDPDSWWTFRCCKLIEGDEPLCLRDPLLGPEHSAVTPCGHARQDFFEPIVDWDSVGWAPIARAYGFGDFKHWNRDDWRKQRYQRRKAWKRRASKGRGMD
ncbi:MAG: hypothetical protein M5U25_12135 [Planctomycetota bacterium]|nr:hypothetical protein [Planctomycetota bacterium]